MPNVILTPHLAFFTKEALKTIADTTLKNIQGVREGSGPPKQNGVLDTVCRAPPPKAASGGYAVEKTRSDKERKRRMSFMAKMAEAAPEMKEDCFPPLQNTEGSFQVVFYSTMPHDKEIFEQMNEEFQANITFRYHSSTLSLDSTILAKGCDAVCVFAHDDCSAEVLTALKALGIKMITLRCAGFDNVDLEKADELGLQVARVPAYSAYSTGELAAALATSVNRNIPQAADGTRRSNFALNGLLGFDMVGKKVGIIGTGLTGTISARIFKNGYSCEVIAHDVVEKPKIREAPPLGLGIPYVSLDEIFTTSDIICLHVPLSRETTKIINADSISKMKRGVIIVNVSRGELIDNRALIQGLREGIVGGAGLDVMEGEAPYVHHDWSTRVVQREDLMTLVGFNNVVVTAHQAWYTREALQSIVYTTLSNLSAARRGVNPPWQRGRYETLLTKK